MRLKTTAVLFAALLGVFLSPLARASITLSVQSGDINLNFYNFGTAGTSADPWIIDVTNPTDNASTLKFLADPTASPFGPTNTTGGGQAAGKWFLVTIHNGSVGAFTSYDLELQSVLGTPSTNGDGLSFCQGGPCNNPSSPAWPNVNQVVDARDFINFSGGSLAAGNATTLKFAITQNGTINPDYLVYDPNRVVGVPEPTTLLMIGGGLLVLGLVRRGNQNKKEVGN